VNRQTDLRKEARTQRLKEEQERIDTVSGTFAECSLNVPWMFPECSLNVPWMFSKEARMQRLKEERERIDTVRGTFAECSLNVPWMFPECSLNVPWMFPPFCRTGGNTWWIRRFTPRIRCLVMFTLVLGTHVGKLYCASTLVLSLRGSCGLDRGSWASTSTQTEYSLNVP
jgi:hypothetical protein